MICPFCYEDNASLTSNSLGYQVRCLCGARGSVCESEAEASYGWERLGSTSKNICERDDYFSKFLRESIERSIDKRIK